MIEAVIVDDEPLARKRMRQLLAHTSDFEVICECADGVEAVECVERERPDVVFLDIHMPEMGGLEVVEAIGVDRMPLTVFVTAFDSYAISAFDRHALDYLLKPVDDRRFADTLDRVRGSLARERDDGASLTALLAERPAHFSDRILVRRDDRALFIRVVDIEWVESIGNYVAVHTAGERYVHRGTLRAFETRLDPRRFVRVHRGAVVQIDRIREIRDLFDRGCVVLRGGTELPLSRRCRQSLQRFAPATSRGSTA